MMDDLEWNESRELLDAQLHTAPHRLRATRVDHVWRQAGTQSIQTAHSSHEKNHRIKKYPENDDKMTDDGSGGTLNLARLLDRNN